MKAVGDPEIVNGAATKRMILQWLHHKMDLVLIISNRKKTNIIKKNIKSDF
jgi:hypothetical protein